MLTTILCGVIFLYWSESFSSKKDDSFRFIDLPKPKKTQKEGIEEALKKTNKEIENLLGHKAYLEKFLAEETRKETS